MVVSLHVPRFPPPDDDTGHGGVTAGLTPPGGAPTTRDRPPAVRIGSWVTKVSRCPCCWCEDGTPYLSDLTFREDRLLTSFLNTHLNSRTR